MVHEPTVIHSSRLLDGGCGGMVRYVNLFACFGVAILVFFFVYGLLQKLIFRLFWLVLVVYIGRFLSYVYGDFCRI